MDPKEFDKNSNYLSIFSGKSKSKPKKSISCVADKKTNLDPPSTQKEKPKRKLYNCKKTSLGLGESDANNNSSITNYFKPSQSEIDKPSSVKLDLKQDKMPKHPMKNESCTKLTKSQPLKKRSYLDNKLKTKPAPDLMKVCGLKKNEKISSAKSENEKLETNDLAREVSDKETANDLSQTSSEFTESQESAKTSKCENISESDLYKELSESGNEKRVEKKIKKSTKYTASISKVGNIKKYLTSKETKPSKTKPILDSSDDDLRPTQRMKKRSIKESNSAALKKAKRDLKFDDSSSEDMKPSNKTSNQQNSKTDVNSRTSFEGILNNVEKKPCVDIYNFESSQSSPNSEKTVPQTRSMKNKDLFMSSCPSLQSSQDSNNAKTRGLNRMPKKKKEDEKTSPSHSPWMSKKNQTKITVQPKKVVMAAKSKPRLNNPNLNDKEFHQQLKRSKMKPDRRKRPPPNKEETLKETQDILKTPPRPKLGSKTRKQLAMIDEIGQKMKNDVEKKKKYEELEKKLEHIVITSSPTIAKTKEKLAEMNSFIQESTLMKLPPGLNIVNSEKFHCYFHNICDLHDENFEKCLPNVLCDKDIDDTSIEFLDKLFKVVSSLNDDISHDVNPLLERLAKKNLQWQPKMHHVVVALINFGVRIENCPLQELFLNQKLRLDKIAFREENIFDDELSNQEQQSKILGGNNLIMIFEILHLCLTRGNSYDTSTLCNFILMICWLRMEKNYLEHPMVIRFQECCSLALDQIPERIWHEKKQFLSSKLSEMDPERHHHNLAFIAEFIPATSRGIELRQLTSFKMIKLLFNFPVSSVDEKFDYELLYHFLKRNPIIVNKDNYYESRSKILLIDYCLDLYGDWLKENGDSLTYLKKIGNLLHNFSMQVIDNIRQQDSTEIKNLLIQIRCKVVLYSHGRDVNEACVDRLMDNSQPSPAKGRKRVRKSRELFPIKC